jgi:citrate lyase subunit beta/citryl-CoA lyase
LDGSSADCTVLDLTDLGDDPDAFAAVQLWARKEQPKRRAGHLPPVSAPDFQPAVALALQARLDTVFLSGVTGGADVQRLEVMLRVEEAGSGSQPLAIVALVDEAGLLAAQTFQRCSRRLFALGLDSAGIWQDRDSDIARVARAQLLIAARAAEMAALDTLPGEADLELFKAECARSRTSGFAGRFADRPDQIGIINAAFSQND